MLYLTIEATNMQLDCRLLAVKHEQSTGSVYTSVTLSQRYMSLYGKHPSLLQQK
jgi:hypothetical protein